MNQLYVLVLTLSGGGTISTPRGTEQINEDGWGLNENIFLLFRSSDTASSLRPGSQSDQPNLESRHNALIFSSKFTGCSNEMQCDTTLICLRRTDRDHSYHWFTITFNPGPDTPFIMEFSFSCASLVTPPGNDCTSNRTPHIHPVVLLVGAAVIAPPLLALGSVIVSSVHRIIASGTVLMALIFAAVVPGSGSRSGPRSGPPLLGGLLRCLGSGPGSILGTGPLPGSGLLLLYRL